MRTERLGSNGTPPFKLRAANQHGPKPSLNLDHLNQHADAAVDRKGQAGTPPVPNGLSLPILAWCSRIYESARKRTYAHTHTHTHAFRYPSRSHSSVVYQAMLDVILKA